MFERCVGTKTAVAVRTILRSFSSGPWTTTLSSSASRLVSFPGVLSRLISRRGVSIAVTSGGSRRVEIEKTRGSKLPATSQP
jgi:hypothetical protein